MMILIKLICQPSIYPACVTHLEYVLPLFLRLLSDFDDRWRSRRNPLSMAKTAKPARLSLGVALSALPAAELICTNP